jgi:hypothetical protein
VHCFCIDSEAQSRRSVIRAVALKADLNDLGTRKETPLSFKREPISVKTGMDPILCHSIASTSTKPGRSPCKRFPCQKRKSRGEKEEITFPPNQNNSELRDSLGPIVPLQIPAIPEPQASFFSNTPGRALLKTWAEMEKKTCITAPSPQGSRGVV